jgi:very-short-patch-repair endonuclease
MKPIKKQFARHLRKNQTECERIVWKFLRNRKFEHLKIRRQHVIRGFIVDFFCDELKLAIEIDGWVHEKQKDYDRARDKILKSKGIKIIRIKNKWIVEDLDGVMRKLEDGPHPLSLSHREREAKPSTLADLKQGEGKNQL